LIVDYVVVRYGPDLAAMALYCITLSRPWRHMVLFNRGTGVIVWDVVPRVMIYGAVTPVIYDLGSSHGRGDIRETLGYSWRRSWDYL
jgi:hypothetical protein